MNTVSDTKQFTITTTLSADSAPSTERFDTAEQRLQRLRERAQLRFPGGPVPMPLGWTDEAETLALLLGFFLMLSDGSVILAEN